MVRENTESRQKPEIDESNLNSSHRFLEYSKFDVIDTNLTCLCQYRNDYFHTERWKPSFDLLLLLPVKHPKIDRLELPIRNPTKEIYYRVSTWKKKFKVCRHFHRVNFSNVKRFHRTCSERTKFSFNKNWLFPSDCSMTDLQPAFPGQWVNDNFES